ncbi:6-pyruvoyl-tetrahydropterin synthase-related protein [Deinococcus sedimenti]|uniref:6-pyruvoyl-tetrahydropterin synthase-related protein n=1 Tax=Deinococcus sedimenti TaxID=1867090 RepID=UPI0016655AC0|nr:6-pyruvoyl-tetrahydropterin synthase-related protein [Deinococcus sedimenti]
MTGPRPSLHVPGAQLPAGEDERAGGRLLAFALLLMLVLHGTQLISGSFTRTYDALIHVYFGAHYAKSFFDPWESGWYTGFSLTSYPPLSHYLIALLSFPLGLMGAFAATQILALTGLTVGLYRFGKVFVTARAAGYGAVLLILSSAIAETVQVFGQLPTTLSLGLLLNAIPFAVRWVRTGQKTYLVRAAMWTAATTAAHHVTTLFGSVFFIAPVLLAVVLEGASRPRPGEGTRGWWRVWRRVYRVLPRVYRGGLYGASAIMALVLVVLPYWLWSRADPITQVPIPHGSRANFLQRRDFGFMFWLVPWATLLPLYWDAVRRGLSAYRGLPRWPIMASILLLSLLGTGGTTPIPKKLLRGAFDILTLDRFTFWACMLILPLAGLTIESWRHGAWRVFVQARFGARVHHLLGLLLVTLALAVSVGISALTYYRKFQPERIDVAPIVNFLESGGRDRYRYMVLGFGDQMAWLSANTRATTPDGNYHSARKLPELTATPVERLEGAKYTGVPGLGSLRQFMTTPAKYNLRFMLSNDAFYDPALHMLGWVRLGTLPGGIMVWERPGIPEVQPRLPRRELPVWQRLMWGLLPSSAPVLALLSLLLPVGAGRAGRSRWPWVRLLAEDSLEPPPQQGAWWHSWVRRLPLRSWRTARLRSKRRPLALRLVNSGLLFAALLAGGVGAYLKLRPQQTPQQAVLGYWDDLDFKRFGAAYRWIEPQDGLTEERWRLDLSVVGGLRTGYAKLDSLRVLGVSYSGPPGAAGTVATVRSRLTWFTALGDLTEEISQDLRRTPVGWRLLVSPTLTVRPPLRFQPVPGLQRTAPAADEPVPLRVLNRRLVAFRSGPGAPEQVAVVGEVQNVGRQGASLTLSASVSDAAGEELGRNDATETFLPWLNPGERTPFLITFDGPGMTVDVRDVVRFDVRAAGVATSRNLDRDLNLWRRGDLVRVENTGAAEATLTNVIGALEDGAGTAWVERAYLMEAVPPMQSRETALPLALPAGYRVLGGAAAPGRVRGARLYAHAFHREEP